MDEFSLKNYENLLWVSYPAGPLPVTCAYHSIYNLPGQKTYDIGREFHSPKTLAFLISNWASKAQLGILFTGLIYLLNKQISSNPISHVKLRKLKCVKKIQLYMLILDFL